MTPEIPEGYSLPETDAALLAECEVHVFRATGPGGQGVNTTDSAVRLKHLPTGVVVLCRRERSQHRNKQICLGRLRERITAAMAAAAPTPQGDEALARRQGASSRREDPPSGDEGGAKSRRGRARGPPTQRVEARLLRSKAHCSWSHRRFGDTGRR